MFIILHSVNDSEGNGSRYRRPELEIRPELLGVRLSLQRCLEGSDENQRAEDNLFTSPRVS